MQKETKSVHYFFPNGVSSSLLVEFQFGLESISLLEKTPTIHPLDIAKFPFQTIQSSSVWITSANQSPKEVRICSKHDERKSKILQNSIYFIALQLNNALEYIRWSFSSEETLGI